MTKLYKTINTCFNLLKKNLENKQTVRQICCNSLFPKLYYTLCTDLFQNAIQCETIFEYSSQHWHEINSLFTKVLKFLTSENIIPPHVKDLSERPISKNKIHLLNSCKLAMTASFALILKPIQIGKRG